MLQLTVDKFQDTSKIRGFELDYNLQYFLDERRKSHSRIASGGVAKPRPVESGNDRGETVAESG